MVDRPPAPVIAEMREADFLRYLNDAIERQRGVQSIDRDRITERLGELRQAEAQAMAEVNAIQGAIVELERYWLPLLESIEKAQGESKTKVVKTDGRAKSEA